MAVTIIDTKHSSGAPTGNSYEASFAVAAGECLLLSIGYGFQWGAADSISSVVLDPAGANQTLSFVELQVHTGTTARRQAVYVLNAASANGTVPIRVTFDGSNNDSCTLLLRRISGHDATGAVRASVGDQHGVNASNPISSVLASSVDDLVVDFLYHRDELAYISAAAGQTDVARYAPLSSSVHASSAKTGAASVTMGWESSDTLGPYDASHIMVSIKPSSGGSPPLGTVTISDVTPGVSSALVTYSYDDSDQTGFEYRIDGGSPAALGASPATISGLTAETEYDLEVRATNAAGAGAWSSVETFETLSGDETGPVMVGDIEVSSLTRTGYTLTWEAATDNVAVTGYEVSVDGGSTWADVGDVLTTGISGRTPGSTDAVRVRAYDAAENVAATPLSASVTLNTGAIVISDQPFRRNNGTVISGKTMDVWVHEADGDLVVATTGATDGSGIATADIESNSIQPSTSYRVDYRFADGEFGVDWITSEAT